MFMCFHAIISLSCVDSIIIASPIRASQASRENGVILQYAVFHDCTEL